MFGRLALASSCRHGLDDGMRRRPASDEEMHFLFEAMRCRLSEKDFLKPAVYFRFRALFFGAGGEPISRCAMTYRKKTRVADSVLSQEAEERAWLSRDHGPSGSSSRLMAFSYSCAIIVACDGWSAISCRIALHYILPLRVLVAVQRGRS